MQREDWVSSDPRYGKEGIESFLAPHHKKVTNMLAGEVTRKGSQEVQNDPKMDCGWQVSKWGLQLGLSDIRGGSNCCQDGKAPWEHSSHRETPTRIQRKETTS